MKVYRMIDGTLAGFYQEAGAELTVRYYEDVYEDRQVKHTEMVMRTTPKNLVRRSKWLPGHYESRKYFVPEHEEYQLVIVEAHYEYKTWTEAAHFGTREYWLEPHIEIKYRFVGTPEQRAGRAGWDLVDEDYVFVGTSEQRAGRAGWESYEVEIPGCWEERRIWFPEVTRTTKTWVPMHEEEQLVMVPEKQEVREEWAKGRVIDYWVDVGSKEVWEEKTWYEMEKVFVGRLAVYSLIDPSEAWTFTVEELITAPADEPDVEDIITIRNVLTGEILRTTATYVGMATRIDDNEYVVP